MSDNSQTSGANTNVGDCPLKGIECAKVSVLRAQLAEATKENERLTRERDEARTVANAPCGCDPAIELRLMAAESRALAAEKALGEVLAAPCDTSSGEYDPKPVRDAMRGGSMAAVHGGYTPLGDINADLLARATALAHSDAAGGGRRAICICRRRKTSDRRTRTPSAACSKGREVDDE